MAITCTACTVAVEGFLINITQPFRVMEYLTLENPLYSITKAMLW